MNIDDHVLSLSSILKRIDEYGLYCHYLGFDPEIRETYSSPIREGDVKPSFSFYNAYPGLEIEFMWKDGALDKSGTILQLVMYMYNITFAQALKKIDADFKLGFTDGTYNVIEKKLIIKKPKYKEASTIEVVSKKHFTPVGIEFRKSFGISNKTLCLYNVTQLESSVINGVVCQHHDITFAYRIGTKYKIYSPLKSIFKFLNNYPATYSEGFIQLTKTNDLLIITKSMKDVMVLHELGYEALSPRSETSLLPKEYFKWFGTNYNQIIVLFDNDMKHNGSKYPYEKKYVPLDSGCKDISDYRRKFGKRRTLWMIQELLK